jgi:hypothetical protein
MLASQRNQARGEQRQKKAVSLPNRKRPSGANSKSRQGLPTRLAAEWRGSAELSPNPKRARRQSPL